MASNVLKLPKFTHIFLSHAKTYMEYLKIENLSKSTLIGRQTYCTDASTSSPIFQSSRPNPHLTLPELTILTKMTAFGTLDYYLTYKNNKKYVKLTSDNILS